MQNAALEELGLANEWRYEAIDIAPEDFEATVGEMVAGDFVGANVTIPHKEAALRLADTASPQAKAIGAANTLSFRHGSIHADNTDAGGLIDALPSSPANQRALVLGAGGAARAVVWALCNEGARVEVWNRTAERATDLCSDLGGTPTTDPRQGNYDLIVNTTSVGLHGENPFGGHLPLGQGEFKSEQVVVDLAYSASPTKLVRAAREANAPTIDGIEILVRQGARSLQIWTRREPPLDTMRSAARVSNL
jgi:shikimate dehydrogenase